MSLFKKGDSVMDGKSGERLLVVEEPNFCTENQQWEYCLIPDASFSMHRFESDLLTLNEGSANEKKEPTDQEALAEMFRVMGAAAPALTQHPEAAECFIKLVETLQSKTTLST